MAAIIDIRNIYRLQHFYTPLSAGWVIDNIYVFFDSDLKCHYKYLHCLAIVGPDTGTHVSKIQREAIWNSEKLKFWLHWNFIVKDWANAFQSWCSYVGWISRWRLSCDPVPHCISNLSRFPAWGVFPISKWMLVHSKLDFSIVVDGHHCHRMKQIAMKSQNVCCRDIWRQMDSKSNSLSTAYWLSCRKGYNNCVTVWMMWTCIHTTCNEAV